MPKESPIEIPPKGMQFQLIEEKPRYRSLERKAFVEGLFNEMNEQYQRYLALVGQMADLQARMTVSERSLALTRDHLNALLSETDEELPPNWRTTLNRIRFVGLRLGDACLKVLREHKTITTDAMMNELNGGQFRFRTGSPLREINAALLRHPRVRRVGDRWIYKSKKEAKEIA